MSDNVSIEEIIKRAQEIKSEAEKRLEEAEKSLDEKAKQAIEDVVVDEEAVAKRIAQAYERTENEEDVKEYVLSKSTAEKSKNDDKTKIIPSIDETENEGVNDKTLRVELPEKDGKAKNEKTKNIEVKEGNKEEDEDIKIFPAKKDKAVENKDDGEIQASFISSSPKKPEGSELQDIPTIVSAQSVNNFNVDREDADNEIETGTQIRLKGFDENIDTVEKVDEEQVEKELEKRREKKVGKFRLFGPDETDSQLGDTPVAQDDYEKESEKDDFIDKLVSKRSAVTVKLVVTALLFVPLVLMTIFKDSENFPLFLSSNTAYFSVLTGLYLLTIITDLNVFQRGFNFKQGFNSDTPICIVSLGILAHSAVSIFDAGLWYDNGIALPAAGAFAIFMSQLGKEIMMRRIVSNFETITAKKDKYTVENITNNVDARIIARSIIDSEDPLLKMSVKCDFPTNFLEISCKREPADKISKRIFIIDLILCAVLFVPAAIFENINTAFNISLSAFAVSMPVSALFLSNIQLLDVSNQLTWYGSVVCGYEGANVAQSADAFVMEAADLFAENSCDFHGIKTFGGAKVDDAIIYAAAVIVQTKSPLAKVFDDIIIGKQSILPKVDNLVYEEKMGTSAWVYNKKILVGTRQMMSRHDIALPKKSFEEKYTVKGRKALYLAVDGNLTAMFIVSYNADPDLKRELKKLEKTGVTLIVKSSDPYINEESLRDLFDLPEGFIRVMNFSAARVYEKYSKLDVEKSPAYVVHSGSALGLVSAVRGSGILMSSVGLMSFLMTFGALLGFAIVAVLGVFGAFSQITAQSIILYQLIWTLFSYVAVKLRSSGV